MTAFIERPPEKAYNLYKWAESNSAYINVSDSQLCSQLPDKPFILAMLQFLL